MLFTHVSVAEIQQQLFLSYDPDPNVLFNDIVASDSITGATEAEIDRALIANLNGMGYNAFGSVGEFGNYGVSGSIFTRGELRAQVVILSLIHI